MFIRCLFSLKPHECVLLGGQVQKSAWGDETVLWIGSLPLAVCLLPAPEGPGLIKSRTKSFYHLQKALTSTSYCLSYLEKSPSWKFLSSQLPMERRQFPSCHSLPALNRARKQSRSGCAEFRLLLVLYVWNKVRWQTRGLDWGNHRNIVLHLEVNFQSFRRGSVWLWPPFFLLSLETSLEVDINLLFVLSLLLLSLSLPLSLSLSLPPSFPFLRSSALERANPKLMEHSLYRLSPHLPLLDMSILQAFHGFNYYP